MTEETLTLKWFMHKIMIMITFGSPDLSLLGIYLKKQLDTKDISSSNIHVRIYLFLKWYLR